MVGSSYAKYTLSKSCDPSAIFIGSPQDDKCSCDGHSFHSFPNEDGLPWDARDRMLSGVGKAPV